MLRFIWTEYRSIYQKLTTVMCYSEMQIVTLLWIMWTIYMIIFRKFSKSYWHHVALTQTDWLFAVWREWRVKEYRQRNANTAGRKKDFHTEQQTNQNCSHRPWVLKENVMSYLTVGCWVRCAVSDTFWTYETNKSQKQHGNNIKCFLTRSLVPSHPFTRHPLSTLFAFLKQSLAV